MNPKNSKKDKKILYLQCSPELNGCSLLIVGGQTDWLDGKWIKFLYVNNGMNGKGIYRVSSNEHRASNKYRSLIKPLTVSYSDGNKQCVKSVQIRSFFWSVFSRIRTEHGKIRTRKNSVFGHFLHSEETNLISVSFL